MLASFRSLNSTPLWRAISIVCVMMVCSYIFFEVLDLDGSNFPLRYPVDSTAIMTEVETNIVRPYLTRLAGPWTWNEISFSVLTDRLAQIYFYLTQLFVVSSVNSLQCRGYRIGLPRSSIPDPFPFCA